MAGTSSGGRGTRIRGVVKKAKNIGSALSHVFSNLNVNILGQNFSFMFTSQSRLNFILFFKVNQELV